MGYYNILPTGGNKRNPATSPDTNFRSKGLNVSFNIAGVGRARKKKENELCCMTLICEGIKPITLIEVKKEQPQLDAWIIRVSTFARTL